VTLSTSYADLHCHTSFSVDGYGTPEDKVARAKEIGLQALSITDHNSVRGTVRAIAAAQDSGIEYIPGVELDLFWGPPALCSHFLCYWYDPAHEGFRALVERQGACYEMQTSWILQQLEITGNPVNRLAFREWLESTYPQNPMPSMWRLAEHLEQLGRIPAGAKPIEHLLGLLGAPVLWHFAWLTDALPVLRDAGALVLLAHPGRIGETELWLKPMRDLLDEGKIDGFELYHYGNLTCRDLLLHVHRECGCAISGGSDCHDADRMDSPFGVQPQVPAHVVDTMRDAYRRRYDRSPS
jgi:predicted metal-dependent phosphoesterase TrpH